MYNLFNGSADALRDVIVHGKTDSVLISHHIRNTECYSMSPIDFC